jgi:hypothetical protein
MFSWSQIKGETEAAHPTGTAISPRMRHAQGGTKGNNPATTEYGGLQLDLLLAGKDETGQDTGTALTLLGPVSWSWAAWAPFVR